MGAHRVSISPDCVSKFNELKLSKKIKYILYKLTDDFKEIVVEEASEDGDWDAFREKLVTAQSKSKTVCFYVACCYCLGLGWVGRGFGGRDHERVRC